MSTASKDVARTHTHTHTHTHTDATKTWPPPHTQEVFLQIYVKIFIAKEMSTVDYSQLGLTELSDDERLKEILTPEESFLLVFMHLCSVA